ncbi:UNVERIFIED_CONTAM: hypothetical protein HDU68_001515 [Siphonaria sp. JEL0065]|nr:hypothetical protein HDU68_001515 [Siphonaria sp. JEL0065]
MVQRFIMIAWLAAVASFVAPFVIEDQADMVFRASQKKIFMYPMLLDNTPCIESNVNASLVTPCGNVDDQFAAILATALKNNGPFPKRVIQTLVGTNVTQLKSIELADWSVSYDSESGFPDTLNSFVESYGSLLLTFAIQTGNQDLFIQLANHPTSGTSSLKKLVASTVFPSPVLYESAKRGLWQVCQRLLEKPERLVDVNSVESGTGKRTALYAAVRAKSLLTVQVLLGAGADFFKKNAAGQLPLQKANGEEYALLKTVMRRNELVLDKRGMTRIQKAVWNQDVELVKKLIAKDVPEINKKDKSTVLHYAAENYHEKILSLLLNEIKYKKFLSTTNDGGRRPIHWACESGNAEAVRQLLRAGVSVEIKTTSFKETCLHLAADMGRVEVIELLLENGANADAKDSISMTPLHLAAQHGYLEIVRALVDHGAKVEPKDSQGQSPFYFAIKNEHIPVAEYLASKGATVRCTDAYGQTCAFVATIDGRLESLKFLAKHGVPLDAENPEDGSTPLVYAVSQDLPEVVQYLLENGANKNKARSKSEQNAFHRAVNYGQFNSVRILLKHGGTKINARTSSKKTALHFASGDGYFDIAELLLEHGANANVKDEIQMTPLHLAASNNHADIVNLLLDNGAEIDATSGKKLTPLHYAVTSGHKEIALLLLDRGANANQLFNNGLMNLLHWASQEGNLFWVKELVDRGVDVGIKNSDAMTALHLAIKTGYQNVAMHLLTNGEGMEVRGLQGWTALHWAVVYKNLKLVKRLVELGANVNVKDDSNNSTPLHFAALLGELDIVKVLVHAGADLFARNADGRNAFDLAVYYKFSDVADYLEDSSLSLDL